MIELYSHQKKAIQQMHNGCILVADVGTGKSLTSLAYYFIKVCNGDISDGYHKMRNPKDLYIITTARKRDSREWEGELGNFLLSSDNKLNIYYPKAKVVVDSWNNIHKYKNVEDAFFIFDEQRLVGYGSWSKTFINISKHNQWILLSATPGDSWNDYRAVFIANGFFRNKTEFEHKHCVFNPYVKYKMIQKYVNTDYLIKCRQRILVHMRYTKKTIKHHINVVTDYNLQDYDRIYKDRWNIYTNEPCKQVSEFCYALRKVCNSNYSKIIDILEILETKNKAIIFYNFDYELEMLENMCVENDIDYTQWNGHKHQEIEDTDRWVYLVQYDAGSEAWNCILCDTIIFMSPTYSYKKLIQAQGRIDRLNTKFVDLYYYHLYTTSSIDNSINLSLKHKKKFNESIFVNRRDYESYKKRPTCSTSENNEPRNWGNLQNLQRCS